MFSKDNTDALLQENTLFKPYENRGEQEVKSGMMLGDFGQCTA